MNIQLGPPLENELAEFARRHSVTVDELVERVLSDYLRQTVDDTELWNRVMQGNLKNVWPAEDFSDWNPPNGQ